MTDLLSKVIGKISSLPPNLQDEIANQLLEDINEELKWKDALDKPANEIEYLAKKAQEDSVKENTKKYGFDEL